MLNNPIWNGLLPEVVTQHSRLQWSLITGGQQTNSGSKHV